MNCKTAQRQMALAVGEDLAPADAQELQSHVRGCLKCQQIWESHQRGFAVLQRSRSLEAAKQKSCWPHLSVRLQERQKSSPGAEFNGWIGALAVTAACVLIFVFSQEDSSFTTARTSRNSAGYGTMISSPRSSVRPSLRRDDVDGDQPYYRDSRPVLDRP